MRIILSTILACVFVFTASAQKHLASDLLSPDYNGETLNSMATVCLMSTVKQSEQTEGIITRSTAKYRFKTIPTASALHNQVKLNANQFKTYLSALNAEAILIVKLLPYNNKKEKVSLPLIVSDDPRDPRHKSEASRRTTSSNFYSHIYPSYQVTGKTETWTNAENLRVQFTLIRIADEQVIWTGFSDFIKTKKLDDSLPLLVEEAIDAINAHNLIKSL